MKRYPYILAGFALIACFSIWLGIRKEHLLKADGSDSNVILITLDTVRTDHLGCYGSRDVATPNIDALARESVLFFDTNSHAPTTAPSHASILTGTYPLFHGVHRNGGPPLDSRNITLAEVLRDKGYFTAAFIGGFPLDAQFGFSQGFDLYDQNFSQKLGDKKWFGVFDNSRFQRPATEVTDAALKWLEDAPSKPLFIWLHYFDAHDPYEPPEPYKSQYPEQPYRGEVAYVDAEMGRFLNGYQRKFDDQSTIIVLTADHGESLGQHGLFLHSWVLYQDTLWTPLLISAPELPQSKKIHALVRSIDIMPTVLDLLRLPQTSNNQGISLLPLMVGRNDYPPKISYFESYTWRYFFFSESEAGGRPERETGEGLGIRVGNWKFFERASEGEVYLFNLTEDPLEMTNLAAKYPEKCSDLRKSLKEAIEKRSGSHIVDSKPFVLDAESRKKLKALGYVE